jgi:D-alanyl-D-alanine carboxypeptidase/D-alanyl-D-alanine-endopeptidase (penicillin-binding protein 4)
MAGVAIPAEVRRPPAAPAATGARAWRPTSATPASCHLGGRYPLSLRRAEWAVAYVDPASYAPRVIEAMWRGAGGTLTGQVKWPSAPPPASRW